MRMRAKLLALGAICAALLAFAAPVMADTPAEDAYGSEGTQHRVTEGTLPFTGIDSTLVAVIGAGLVGTGFVVRRAVRTN